MRSRGERGGVAVLTAAAVAVLVGVAAFAVDLGMQRVVRSDMQALADVVALDAARLLDGRTAKQIEDGTTGQPALGTVVASSRARNQSSLGRVTSVTATLVFVKSLPNEVQVPQRTATGALVDVPDGSIPDAVYVEAEGEVDFAFTPGSGGAKRAALSIADSAACFQLGSFAASISPGSAPLFKDLLSPLLGASTLTMVGYNGLATSNLSLLDIIKAPGIAVGTVNELVALPSITVGNFYLAMAHVLQQQGQALQADVLREASASVVAGVSIKVADLFGLSTATDAVLATKFNVLDLLIGAAFLADGDNLVGLPNLQAGLSSVGVTNTSLTIIERAQRACNEDEAKTAQLKLASEIKLQLAIPLIKTPLVDLRLIDPADGKPSAEAPLRLSVDVAGARGRLTAPVECTPDRFRAGVSTELATLFLGGTVTLKGEVKIELEVDLGFGLGLGIEVVDVPVQFQLGISANASKSPSVAPSPVEFLSPPRAYGTPVPAPPGGVTLPYASVAIVSGSLTTGPVSVAGVPISTSTLDAAVNPILQNVLPTATAAISPLVNPLVDKINAILAPLAAGMGLTLAGADFYALPYPRCNAPALRG